MATTENDQSVPPKDCELGAVMWDMGRDVPGVVMGHHGGDRVQMRAVSGGKEWDALRVRPLTAREQLSLRLAARNDATKARP